jgi:hypothetical protein
MPFEHGFDHVNVKVFADSAEPVDIASALPVFHRWICDNVCEELLIDVADYRHIPEGPGVILIGHEANYSLDNRRGRLGLLYNRKAPMTGSVEEKLVQALQASLAACRRLSEEPEWQGRLCFNAGEIEITINDRLLAPNTPENYVAVKSATETALRSVAPTDIEWAIEPAGGIGERLGVCIHAGSRINVSTLIMNHEVELRRTLTSTAQTPGKGSEQGTA